MSSNKILKEIKFSVSESKEVDLNTKPVAKRKRKVDDYDYNDDFIEPFEGEHELVDLECKLENFFVYKGKLPYSAKRLIGFHRKKMKKNEKKLQDEEVKTEENVNNDVTPNENKPTKQKQITKKTEVADEEKDAFIKDIEKVVGVDLLLDSDVKEKPRRKRSPRKSQEDKSIEEVQKKTNKIGRPKKLTQNQPNLSNQKIEPGIIAHKNVNDQQINIQKDMMGEKLNDIRMNHGNLSSLSNPNGFNISPAFNRNNLPYQGKHGIQRKNVHPNDFSHSVNNSEYLKSVIQNDQNDGREYRSMVINNDIHRNHHISQFREGTDRLYFNSDPKIPGSYFEGENKLINYSNNPELYMKYNSQQLKGHESRNQIFPPEMMFGTPQNIFPKEDYIIAMEGSKHANRNYDSSQNYGSSKIVNPRNMKYVEPPNDEPSMNFFHDSKMEPNKSLKRLSYDQNDVSSSVDTSGNTKIIKRGRKRKNKEVGLLSENGDFGVSISLDNAKSNNQEAKDNVSIACETNIDFFSGSPTNENQDCIYNNFKEPIWNYIHGKMEYLEKIFQSINDKIYFYYFNIILFKENKREYKENLKTLKVIKNGASEMEKYFTEIEIKDWYSSVTQILENNCDHILNFATDTSLYSKNLTCFDGWKNDTFRRLCLVYIYSFICKNMFDTQNESPLCSFKAAKDSIRTLFNEQCKTAKFMIHINSLIRKMIKENDFSI